MPWICEMVRGGFVPNWCARAAFERTSVSVAVLSVVVAGIAWGWASWVDLLEVGAMSPGATLGD